ncbi:hypothetical protein O181_049202 [Austropuccinia psidii MF-1]|uniref:Uncharacterized protein n=1 Tax=Austropuccinia psidii MF-1 TaxID=1389203 RepID=A0A9Q3HME0_9BASI|nr:hypothetical protein [Austropuccinia psidii MF-1]
MGNSFEEAIFKIERDRPTSWLLKQKNILTAIHPDISETMVHKRILRKCWGELENAIRSRFIEPCSTEECINAMEEITTRTKIGRNWCKSPIDNRTSGKPISRKNKPQDRAPLKFHTPGKMLRRLPTIDFTSPRLPSRHASDTALTPPSASSRWINPQLCLPSLCSCRALTTPYASAPPLIFSATYHPYAPAEPSRYASNTATSSRCSSLLTPPPLTILTLFY